MSSSGSSYESHTALTSEKTALFLNQPRPSILLVRIRQVPVYGGCLQEYALIL
jgi:hypothetical protein